jgi:uncharacterized protein (DUF433 family)
MKPSEFVEQRNGGFYVAGARVSLDSIVYAFKSGDSPETIRENFASLTLGQVYGAIAFYLSHSDEIDRNIADGEEDLQRTAPPLSQSHTRDCSLHCDGISPSRGKRHLKVLFRSTSSVTVAA